MNSEESGSDRCGARPRRPRWARQGVASRRQRPHRPRRRELSALAIAILASGVALWACGSGGESAAPQAGPRRVMLRALAATVILPTYDRLTADAALLVDAAAALEATPSADTLAAARHAWRRARSTWKQSEAFSIGPAESLRSVAKFDWTPIRADRIEREIDGTAELTAAYVEDLGANVKGFIALEYLLFDPSGDSASLAQLADPRRRAYVRALAGNLRDQTVLLRDAWAPTGGNFAATLSEAGPGNPTFPTVKSAVDAIVNRLIFLAEDVADTQLLAALGTRAGGTPQPDALDAHRSENGLADLLDNLAGIENLYFGAYADRSGSGFHDVVANLSPEIDGALDLAIRRALETGTRIPVPLEEAVISERALVERAQARAKELMARLEIDLVSVLGTTLRFNPSDGD